MLIHVGYLIFSSCTRSDILRYLHDRIIEEIYPGNGIVGLRILRFFLDGESFFIRIEFDDPVPFRIMDMVSEYGSPVRVHARLQNIFQVGTVEYIVTEYQADFFGSDKFFSDDECLGEPIRFYLFLIFESASEFASVSEEVPEPREIVWGGDDEYLIDTRRYKGGNRVIDHRLVIDGHELFAYSHRYRVESRTGASGENDSFHMGFILRDKISGFS